MPLDKIIKQLGEQRYWTNFATAVRCVTGDAYRPDEISTLRRRVLERLHELELHRPTLTLPNRKGATA